MLWPMVLQQELKERVLHFSRDKLWTLKAQVNAEAGVGAGCKISSLQSLSHIWRAVTRNWKNPNPDRETEFILHVGLLSKLQPKIPENYLGNALARCPVVLKEKVSLKEEKGLGDVAPEINKVVMEHKNDEKLKEEVESWIENPQMRTLGGIVKGWMVLSSSPRYDIYGNDFGWGKPVAVRSGAGNKFDGKVTVFPGMDEGSMEVEICLSTEIADRLGIDSEFISAVGV